MKSCNCPSCGASIAFQSSLSVYAVCKYCSSMVVRRDLDVESIGTMAALPQDMSPFQIGTQGKFDGVGFGIIGRMKLSWEDGYWNEWCILSEDGRRGWLAEAQGFYAVSFEIAENEELKEKNLDSLPVGSFLKFHDSLLKIVDIKEATCVGCEGELPFVAPKGRKTKSLDLVGKSGEFASIEIENNQRRVYLGRYVEWENLHCQNFRILEGW
jgi:hypothetical protein